MIWSVGRIAGLSSDQPFIADLALEVEPFVVVTPVVGLNIGADAEVGPVTFTRQSAGVVKALEFVEDVELRTEFFGPGVWASVAVDSAPSLYDAERAGILLIDGALDRLVLDQKYSSVDLPDARRRSYIRARRSADPERVELALVSGHSGRAWLRSLRRPTYDLQGVRPTADLLEIPPPGAHARFDLAVAAWRRAIRAIDSATASGALWEALEFYVAGTRLEPEFTEELRDRVIEVAEGIQGLGDGQRVRVGKVLRQYLNQPPVLARLRAALERDEIPFTDVELDLLTRVRRPRTKAQHGKSWTDATAEDLESARSITARILAYWALRLSRR